VRGLVDSQDLSLNISREMLQHDRQLKIIASRLEKKLKSELFSMLQNDRETYETFFKNFGMQFKYSIYSSFGKDKELLEDLLLFASSNDDEHPATLAEYVGRMKEGQDCIYYIAGPDKQKLARMPQTEAVLDHGYELLYLTEDVDEFCLHTLRDYQGKTFKNVTDGDLGLESDEEKKEAEEKATQNKDILDAMTAALDGKVASVRLSSRLKSHPVCLTTEGGMSMDMERVLSAMPGEQGEQFKATRVLEINESHAIWQKLLSLFNTDNDKLAVYAKLLYDQALLIEGFPIEDPIAFSSALCELMTGC